MAHYEKVTTLLLFLGAVFFCGVANAAVLTMDGEQITIEGRILDADVDKYVELSYGKPIKKVIFHASTGGQWRAGQRLGNLLMGRKITTIVDGVCASSCAMAFLGGDTREYAKTTSKNLLIYHAPYLPNQAQPLATLKEAFYAWITLRTGKTVIPEFRAAIDGVNTTDGGVFFFRDDNGQLTTRVCKGDEPIFPKGCPIFETLSPIEMGFIH
jgi:hypothetical protein